MPITSENIDYGLVIKRSDQDYVVMVDASVYNSGYNVVPKSIDSENMYDIEDVQAWCEEHPDKVLTEHPLEGMWEIQNQIAEEKAELEEVNRELFDRMVQKVFNPEVETQDELVPTNEELLSRKAELESSIASLESQMETMVQKLDEITEG